MRAQRREVVPTRGQGVCRAREDVREEIFWGMSIKEWKWRRGRGEFTGRDRFLDTRICGTFSSS